MFVYIPWSLLSLGLMASENFSKLRHQRSCKKGYGVECCGKFLVPNCSHFGASWNVGRQFGKCYTIKQQWAPSWDVSGLPALFRITTVSFVIIFLYSSTPFSPQHLSSFKRGIAVPSGRNTFCSSRGGLRIWLPLGKTGEFPGPSYVHHKGAAERIIVAGRDKWLQFGRCRTHQKPLLTFYEQRIATILWW